MLISYLNTMNNAKSGFELLIRITMAAISAHFSNLIYSQLEKGSETIHNVRLGSQSKTVTIQNKSCVAVSTRFAFCPAVSVLVLVLLDTEWGPVPHHVYISQLEISLHFPSL